MKKFKVCVAGIGFIGAAHVEALRRLGNVEVVAVCDNADAQKKADALFVPKGYGDYKEMMDAEKPDAVHICTPNSTHYEYAKYALLQGVPVLCEKPMTMTAPEAKELAELALSKKIVTGVNFMSRFFPMARQMREMVKSGEVGDIYTVHGGYLQDWLFLDTDYSWRLEPEVSGDSRAFADIGSHWIDLVEHVTGLRAVEVMADFATFHKTRKKPLKPVDTYSGMALRPEDYQEVSINTEDYATVLFHFDNGAHGCCNITQVMAGRKNQMIVAVAGSKCSLQWDSEDSNALWIGRRERDNGQLVKDPSILAEATREVTDYPGGHVEGLPDAFKQTFRNFYAAVEKGDLSQGDFAAFQDGYREMQLNEKVIQSAKEQRWVKI